MCRRQVEPLYTTPSWSSAPTTPHHFFRSMRMVCSRLVMPSPDPESRTRGVLNSVRLWPVRDAGEVHTGVGPKGREVESYWRQLVSRSLAIIDYLKEVICLLEKEGSEIVVEGIVQKISLQLGYGNRNTRTCPPRGFTNMVAFSTTCVAGGAICAYKGEEDPSMISV